MSACVNAAPPNLRAHGAGGILKSPISSIPPEEGGPDESKGHLRLKSGLCVRAARTVTVRSTGQEAGPEQDGGKALQRVCALFLSVLIESD